MGAVGIFWDYGAFPESFGASSLVVDALSAENCQYTAGRSGFDIARNIEEQARCHGMVRAFNAYLDVQQCATPATLRSELQSSGVTLVDCPHNGQKNVVDLMLLSALCAFAPLPHVPTIIPVNFDSPIPDLLVADMLVLALSEPAPSTIVLVSGDRDFAYTASILRQRGHNVVLVCHARPGPHRSLAAQVSECVDWNQTILKMDEEDKAILPAKKKLPTAPSKSVPQVIPGEVATPEEAPEEAAPKEYASIPVSSSLITGERSDAASDSPEADVNSVHPEYSSPVPTRGRSPAPAPYPLPSSIIATQSSPTAKVALFQPLIRVLQAHLRSNDPYPRRSLVGSELITSHPRVYAQANVAGFKEYSAAAEAAGVVVLGGLHAAAWIALTVEYGGIADRKEGSSYSNARPARRMPDHRPPSPPGYPPSPTGYSSAPSSPSPNHCRLSPYSPVSTSDYRSPSPYRSRAYASSYYPRPQSPFRSPPTSPHRDRTYRAYQPAAAVEPWKQARERYRASHSAPTITPPFRTLVNVLDDLRKAGSDRPLRSSVGLRLGREVYKSAGVSTFAEYVNLAVGAGLVRTGGKDGGAWITLDWAVQV